MEPIGCPETSVLNYHSTPRAVPEECRSFVRCSGNPKPRKNEWKCTFLPRYTFMVWIGTPLPLPLPSFCHLSVGNKNMNLVNRFDSSKTDDRVNGTNYSKLMGTFMVYNLFCVILIWSLYGSFIYLSLSDCFMYLRAKYLWFFTTFFTFTNRVFIFYI